MTHNKLVKVVFNLADLESPTRREYSYLIDDTTYNTYLNYHCTQPTQPMVCIVQSRRDIISMAYIVAPTDEYDPSINYLKIVALAPQATDYLNYREQYLKSKAKEQ